jgi:Rap1a immunity proteins
VKSVATALTAAVALLLTAASAEQPPAMTASDLAQLCSGGDHVSRNACRIYILGVTQGIAVGIRMADSSRSARPCVPPGVSAEELELTVKKRLAALGAAQSRDAAGFIGDVLLASYRCAGR